MGTNYLFRRISIISFLFIVCAALIFPVGCKGNKSAQPEGESVKEAGNKPEDSIPIVKPEIKMTVFASIQADKSKVYYISEEGICTLDVASKTFSTPVIKKEGITDFLVSPDGKYIVYYDDERLEAYDLKTQSAVSPARIMKSTSFVFDKWIDTNKLIYRDVKSEDNQNIFLYTIDNNEKISKVQALELNSAVAYLNSSISGDLNTHIYQDEKGRVFYKNTATGMEEMLFIEQYPYDIAVSYDGKRVAYSKAYPTSTYIYNLGDRSNIRVSELTGKDIKFNPYNNDLISFSDPNREEAGEEFILLNTRTKEARPFKAEYINWIDATHFFLNPMERGLSIFNIEADMLIPYQKYADVMQVVVNR